LEEWEQTTTIYSHIRRKEERVVFCSLGVHTQLHVLKHDLIDFQSVDLCPEGEDGIQALGQTFGEGDLFSYEGTGMFLQQVFDFLDPITDVSPFFVFLEGVQIMDQMLVESS